MNDHLRGADVQDLSAFTGSHRLIWRGHAPENNRLNLGRHSYRLVEHQGIAPCIPVWKTGVYLSTPMLVEMESRAGIAPASAALQAAAWANRPTGHEIQSMAFSANAGFG